MSGEMPASWGEFWSLFHARWGSDKTSLDYVKREWSTMQRFLEAVERGDVMTASRGYQREGAR